MTVDPMTVKVSPCPMPELKEFVRPLRQHFYRMESLHTLERFATGLLADVPHKSGSAIAQAAADLSDSALYRLMAETHWDPHAFNRHRLQIMRQRAVAAQPEAAWPTITWRRGSDGPLTKPFVALGVDRAVGERPLPGHAGEKKW